MRKAMDRKVFVIGHKNPDTDSVVSAVAYAALKRATGMPEAIAARAGAVNPQTEYIFDRFALEPPVFIPDLVPKAEYFLSRKPRTVQADTPLWSALASLGAAEGDALPIVDADGRYRSLLHYGSFAQSIIAKVNPRKKAVILTSVRHLVETIKAQALLTFDEDQAFKATMIVAANQAESVRALLDAESAENKILLVGDRDDVQAMALEAGVRVLIVTNGFVVGKETRNLAESKRISVLVSPYDTSSTSLLVLYSTPVREMGDSVTRAIPRGERVRDARKTLASSPSRSAAVVDEDGMVVGLLHEGDLLQEPNVAVIMVDHNEFGQGVEGIENYRILEVIDHHRLGSFSTKYPITFINRVVGSTSTMVSGMYRDQRVPIPKEIAGLLLCGILSDTLILRSATTTEADRDEAEYLANIADLEIAELGAAIMQSASRAASRPAAEIVRQDLKEYESLGVKLSVSQIEVSDTALVRERRSEILSALSAIKEEKGYYLSALMVTDVTELVSLLFVVAGKDFLALVGYPAEEDGVYVLKDMLSRKKQLMPAILEIVEKALG
jgi:manganese-dependent inorganic pyrophosphatase